MNTSKRTTEIIRKANSDLRKVGYLLSSTTYEIHNRIKWLAANGEPDADTQDAVDLAALRKVVA